MTRPRLDVVGAAITDRIAAPTRVLAARRAGPSPLAGAWEFPGGKIDPGERPKQALSRELDEELGIVVRLGAKVRGPLAKGAWPIGVDGVLRIWWAEITVGEPRILDDHDDLMWCGPTELAELDWLPADRAVSVALAQHLGW